jgi:serine/threonine protein kinase
VGSLQPTVVVVEPERGPPGDSRQSLPGELEEIVPHRSGTAAIVFAAVVAVMWASMVVIGLVSKGVYPHRYPWATAEQRARVDHVLSYGPDITFAIGILAGIVTFAISRRKILTAVGAHRLAQAFFILSSWVIAVAESWGPTPPFLNGISWLAAWVIMYPLLVPAPPRRALTSGLIAATALPCAYAISVAVFGESSSLGVVAPRVIGCYLAAAAGFIAAHTMYSLGREVESARQLGAYNLVELLGQGGMGQVWRAEHRQLARPAAIKIIRPDHKAGDHADVLRRRFEREARATARLQSPHTIEVYDYGGIADGSFYYVMELLDGIDLDTLVRDHGPQPAERVASILRQAASSLEEAHGDGLLHRDIKPANLFLCRKGADVDFVKVLDFGLVKSTQSQAQAPVGFATKLTAEGMTSGTPAYMAPEAATGRKDVDARSDIYSLGCVAYFLLTGEPVFGGTPMKILLAHVHDAPQTPGDRLGAPVHEGLSALIMRCLAKQREGRPATIRAVADELATLTFATPWTRERAEAWWAEHLPPGTRRRVTDTSSPIAVDGGPSRPETSDTVRSLVVQPARHDRMRKAR